MVCDHGWAELTARLLSRQVAALRWPLYDGLGMAVAGCWDNVGFGTEHEKARTNFNGRLCYKKAVVAHQEAAI